LPSVGRTYHIARCLVTLQFAGEKESLHFDTSADTVANASIRLSDSTMKTGLTEPGQTNYPIDQLPIRKLPVWMPPPWRRYRLENKNSSQAAAKTYSGRFDEHDRALFLISTDEVPAGRTSQILR
jgi:hypothetical protein